MNSTWMCLLLCFVPQQDLEIFRPKLPPIACFSSAAYGEIENAEDILKDIKWKFNSERFQTKNRVVIIYKEHARKAKGLLYNKEKRNGHLYPCGRMLLLRLRTRYNVNSFYIRDYLHELDGTVWLEKDELPE